MVAGIEQTVLDNIFNDLFTYVFGHYGLLAGFILIFIFIICLANNIDLKLALIVSVPALVGMIGVGWLPTIFWAVPIGMACLFWIAVAFEMLGISKF